MHGFDLHASGLASAIESVLCWSAVTQTSLPLQYGGLLGCSSSAIVCAAGMGRNCPEYLCWGERLADAQASCLGLVLLLTPMESFASSQALLTTTFTLQQPVTNPLIMSMRPNASFADLYDPSFTPAGYNGTTNVSQVRFCTTECTGQLTF